jgi:hypothetical protein
VGGGTGVALDPPQELRNPIIRLNATQGRSGKAALILNFILKYRYGCIDRLFLFAIRFLGPDPFVKPVAPWFPPLEVSEDYAF